MRVISSFLIGGVLLFVCSTANASHHGSESVSNVSSSNKEVLGKDFLEINKSKPGVQELANGLQYRVDQEGSGAVPGVNDEVTVMYEGKLLNGNIFDSSYARSQPATFRVNQVIAGWQSALQKMPVGSIWTLYIPSDLAYGASGIPGVIPPNSVLVFKVELQAVKKFGA